VVTTPLTAVYGGDSDFAASTSKAFSQVIGKATTTVALSPSLNPATFGQPITFSATVTPQISGVPTGTVTFLDGAKVLKTVTLSAGAASFTTSTLTRGVHNITAKYNASTSFTGNSGSLSETVN
jgi:Bacterial Ig-like domain (group 3)